MITVQGAQKLITSAAGGPESNFLLTKRDRGRALVKLGRDSRTAYIEYSAPEDADPNDPMTYLMAHPAIGHTIQLSDIENDRVDMDPVEFNRAYLGWWPLPDERESIIPMNLWSKNYIDPLLDTWFGSPVWALDISPDRQWGSIGFAARSYDPAANCFVEVVDQRNEGTEWMIRQIPGTPGDRVEDYEGSVVALRQRFGGNYVVVDGGGPANALVGMLEAAGFTVYRATAADRMAACGLFYDDATQGHLRYLEDPLLTSAMFSAEKVQAMSGESWVFSRGKSHKDITPLYSVALARLGYQKFAPAMYDPLDSVLEAG